MHSPLEHDTWKWRRDVPAVRAGHSTYFGGDLPIEDGDQRPSFHFPLSLDADCPPTPDGTERLSTVVVVPISENRLEEIEDSVEAIREGHLNFVGLFKDRRDLTVHVETPSDCFTECTWPHDAEDIQQHSEAAGRLADTAQRANEGGAGGRLIYHWASSGLASHAKRQSTNSPDRVLRSPGRLSKTQNCLRSPNHESTATSRR